MKPLRIYLADLTYTTLSLANEAFPLNIGFVSAYCNKLCGQQVEITLFKYINVLQDAIISKPPNILGLSNYPWNYNLGIEIFRLAKEVSPQTLRVMGGPNIPLDSYGQNKFILENPLIDFYAYLEGEQAFSNIVECVMSHGLSRQNLVTNAIDGVISRIDSKTLIKGDWLQRRKTLDDIPSPYLNGEMDLFFDGLLSPIVETNRGCPFSCTFCHEGNSLISKVNYFSIERVKEELNYIASKIPESVTNLMFADPNFGMYERDYEICEQLAKLQQEKKWPKSIFVSTGKNKKERIAKSLKLLNGTMRMWISVQSMDLKVLKNIKRNNIKLDVMMGLSQEMDKIGLPTYSELILGLPGETYESHLNSIANLLSAEIEFISTYNLMLLNGTELNTDSSREKFGLGSHFRILPRNFGKLVNSRIAVEIEEIVTSTNTLSFAEYKKLRVFHLFVNVVYNSGAFKALFKYMKQEKISIYEFLSKLVEWVAEASDYVQSMVNAFKQDTECELWSSYDELKRFSTTEENYKKMCHGELGHNLIQSYSAKAMFAIEHWIRYVFFVTKKTFVSHNKNYNEIILDEMEQFISAKTKGIWDKNGYGKVVERTFLHDIDAWIKDEGYRSLSQFKLDNPGKICFSHSEEQKTEIDSFISRFGITPTGVGRIVVKMGAHRVWRKSHRYHLQSTCKSGIA